MIASNFNCQKKNRSRFSYHAHITIYYLAHPLSSVFPIVPPAKQIMHIIKHYAQTRTINRNFPLTPSPHRSSVRFFRLFRQQKKKMRNERSLSGGNSGTHDHYSHVTVYIPTPLIIFSCTLFGRDCKLDKLEENASGVE